VSDVLLIAVLVATFALVIVLVQLISRMIERDTDPGDLGDLADEPRDTDPPGSGSSGDGVVGPSGWRP